MGLSYERGSPVGHSVAIYFYSQIIPQTPLEFPVDLFPSHASLSQSILVVAGLVGDTQQSTRWILYGKSFNLKTIFKAILATLERIIRFSL